jgi:outer membrane protein
MKVPPMKGGDRLMKIKGVMGFILFALFIASSLWAQNAPEPLTLEEAIRIAMERSLTLHSAKEGVMGAEFNRKSARADFFPKWTGQYSYTRNKEPIVIGSSSTVTTPTTTTTPVTIPVKGTRDVYDFNTGLGQTLLAGGAISSNYRFQKLGVDLSKASVEVAKLDIVLFVREGYFNILRADKFVDVAKQAVRQFEGQLEISQAYFEVGLIPKNDVLQAEVNLANAKQAQVKAENDLFIAKASFNNLLRREINAPVEVVDILVYKPFSATFEESIEEALRQRPELRAAGLSIDQAKETVKITRSGLFPTVTLTGDYNKNSDEAFLNGNLRSENWNIQALATFILWDWGKIYYQVGASKVKVTQAEDSKTQLKESIILEVKDDYLNMLVAEKNIQTASKAIEQAEENLRLNEERYKYQVATAFDVINAVTLLAQARTNYYGSLSDFNIAKAMLERSMGRMYP